MANNPSNYAIIDEPKVKPWEHLIVNPLIILFAAIFLPLLWTPPLHGRIWLPMLWLMVNGYLLGSPSFKREVLYAVCGMLLYFTVVFIYAFILIASGLTLETVDDQIPNPYLIILLQALFFTSLYLIVFKQAVPYELYQYLKQQGKAT